MLVSGVRRSAVSHRTLNYSPKMSFFDDVGEIPELPVLPEPVMHPWFGPPEFVIAGSVPGSTVVFRNEKAALIFDHFNAFQTGLQFTLNLWIREPDLKSRAQWDPPWESRDFGPDLDNPDFLRLGMEFADASKWTNLRPLPFGNPDQPPPGPIVVSQGGGGGRGSWSFQQWMWPLPPAGEIAVHATWPAQGVGETSVTIDATPIVEAARRAEAVWPS